MIATFSGIRPLVFLRKSKTGVVGYCSEGRLNFFAVITFDAIFFGSPICQL
jgi:hypothetical protein